MPVGLVIGAVAAALVVSAVFLVRYMRRRRRDRRERARKDAERLRQVHEALNAAEDMRRHGLPVHVPRALREGLRAAETGRGVEAAERRLEAALPRVLADARRANAM